MEDKSDEEERMVSLAAAPESEQSQDSATEQDDIHPSVTFETITFSDGTEITLDPTDVVVLVGPNNAGKSVALRELQGHVRGSRHSKVVTSAKLRHTGTEKGFRHFIDQHPHIRVTPRNSRLRISGLGFSTTVDHVEDLWPDNVSPIASAFCVPILTEERITASDPADSFDVLNDVPSHPIHLMYSDDRLEDRLSRYFQLAFGEDLIVDRAAGSRAPLLTGCRPTRKPSEDRVSASYVERLRASTVPLQEQGDGMRSFASVVLHLLAPTSASVLLLDEPEAFLHPPQARLLGEVIATEKSSGAQLFVATHSPDVLQGLISVAPEHLRVLRVQRDDNVNRITELDKELVKEITNDPLMSYSSVMSGVFHQRVIICEADADCMFYSSILALSEVHGGERRPDVLFVHANGKHRMAVLAKTLVALGVPADVIADIDILDDISVFRGVVESLEKNSAAVIPLAESVKKAIEQHKPWLNSAEIKNGIADVLKDAPSAGEFPRELRSRINSLFRKASPWDAIKEAGEAAIPPGQPSSQFQKLLKLCRQMGLWIVPVGELEGFYKYTGGHGPRWVQKVIEERDLATDSDLERARQFVRDLWMSAPQESP